MENSFPGAAFSENKDSVGWWVERKNEHTPKAWAGKPFWFPVV
jgi:hypothetical protein